MSAKENREDKLNHYYKVFRRLNGELVSAFESGIRRVHYRVYKESVDHKPKGELNPGLAILSNMEKAEKFLSDCGTNPDEEGNYVLELRHVVPTTSVSPDDSDHIYRSGYTNSLRVGKLIACKDRM